MLGLELWGESCSMANKTSAAKSPSKKSASSQRRLKVKSRIAGVKLRKQIRASYTKLPSSLTILKKSFSLIKPQWKLFVGITIVYSLFCLVLIGGVSSFAVADLKAQVNELLNRNANDVWSSTVVFIYLANRSGLLAAGTAGAYQSLVILITSLALIWSIRQIYADPAVRLRIRDGYYRGVYPLVQFMIVLFVVFVQSLPAILGLFLYNLVTGSIASTSLELAIWAIVAIILVIWSLYMLASSLFAVYIVCLPDMTPMVALRTARNLVRARRWTVLRKIIALPVLLSLVSGLIVIPIIVFLPSVAGAVFVFLSMFSLVVVHAYMYVLYRELL